MQVYAWGRGEDGQLGLGDGCDQLKPRLIEQLNDKDVSQVVCGSGHTVVLSRDGLVYTWGRGDDGRLGHGDHGWKHEPRLVAAVKNKTIVQITCGSYHTAAVSNAGELFTWGGGMYGKLGHGTENGSSVPRKVEALKDKIVIQVACGSRHTVALVNNGGGGGGGGAAATTASGGSSSSRSSTSSSGSDGEVVQVESASSPSGAASLPLPLPLRAGSDTDVYAWGDRESGVAGHGEPLDGHQYVPRLLDALAGKSVCQVAACGFHTGAVTEFGEVFTWGEGKFGRLGHGKENNQSEPRLVEDDKIKNTRIVQIACGGFHTAAITDEGELFTWGGGEHGQLGHGNKENYSRPTLVRAIAGVKIKQVTCGWSHTVMLTEDGEVWSCGNGDHGKLGFGDTEKVTLPKKVEGLASKRICRVASYNEHTAALAMPADGLKAQPNSTLLADFGSLVGNAMFSDVAFLVEGQVIHAHRVVLASRCAHFRAMFLSGMKESRETEVKIMDTRALVFTALMQFLYTDVVDVSPDIAIELFVLADLYALDRLKAQCEAIVHRRLCHGNAPQLLSVADHHNCAQLKQLCLRYIIRHFDVITKSQEFAAVLNRELILEVLQAK